MELGFASCARGPAPALVHVLNGAFDLIAAHEAHDTKVAHGGRRQNANVRPKLLLVMREVSKRFKGHELLYLVEVSANRSQAIT